MSTDKLEHDVAISFLSKDLTIGEALHNRLSQTLKVFFYPRSQEELAGTDGMVSMKTPFIETRVTVVLYRNDWGLTPWTRIEQAAIQEACLNKGWEGLLFIVLDRTDSIPLWLPRNHVRFNWEDFGFEEAVGVIKARALECGALPSVLTPAKRAEMFAEAAAYRADKANMNSSAGLIPILRQVSRLLAAIDIHCVDPRVTEHLGDFRKEKADRSFILTTHHIGMIVRWDQQYANFIENSTVTVEEYDSRLLLTSELSRNVQPRRPKLLRQTKYRPELSLAREYGWTEEGSTEFLSSDALAERCFIQFIDLVDRETKGEIGHRGLF